jgi:hypothetical protein
MLTIVGFTALNIAAADSFPNLLGIRPTEG